MKFIYATIYNKQCLFSHKRLSRNWGYDGTGINCDKSDFDPMKQKLYTANRLSVFCKDDIDLSEYRGEFSWIKEIKRFGVKSLIRAILIIIAYVHMKPSTFLRIKNSIKKVGEIGKKKRLNLHR